MAARDLLSSWPAATVAAGWLDADGTSHTFGDPEAIFRLASVTKPLFALAVLVAVEEGSMPLEQAAGPEGSTVAHLLSHSSGLAPEATSAGGPSYSAPGLRRIYSNQGFELLGSLLAAQTEIETTTYVKQALFEPLGLANTTLVGSPAHGASGSVSDLLTVCRQLLQPTLIDETTLARATSVHLPNLAGVLPGFGRQIPNPWGLGFEIKAAKSPHWTGTTNSPETFGHFGASGTFLWVDPVRRLACVALTDKDFGPWAAQVWPQFNDALIAELS